MTPWLVTGAAEFVGYHVAERLTAEGEPVLRIDNLDDYYDPGLKKARLEQLADRPEFEFRYIDLTDPGAVAHTFESAKPHAVIHLAAQAGVRHSLHRPIEYCAPFSPHHPADHPVSTYAATKRAGELMAHTYSHLFELPSTGLRFVTVYGPWGRPDMAYYRFAEKILSGEPVTVYGDGPALRDFTYIDDITEAVVRIARQPAEPNPAWTRQDPDPATGWHPWRLFNIGYGEQITLNRLVELLEGLLDRSTHRVHAGEQLGDVPATQADTSALERTIDFTPKTPTEDGHVVLTHADASYAPTAAGDGESKLDEQPTSAEQLS